MNPRWTSYVVQNPQRVARKRKLSEIWTISCDNSETASHKYSASIRTRFVRLIQQRSSEQFRICKNLTYKYMSSEYNGMSQIMSRTNRERKFQRPNVSWSEYSWVRKFQGANWPGSYIGRFAPGSELARERKGCESFLPTTFKSRTPVCHILYHEDAHDPFPNRLVHCEAKKLHHFIFAITSSNLSLFE